MYFKIVSLPLVPTNLEPPTTPAKALQALPLIDTDDIKVTQEIHNFESLGEIQYKKFKVDALQNCITAPGAHEP